MVSLDTLGGIGEKSCIRSTSQLASICSLSLPLSTFVLVLTCILQGCQTLPRKDAVPVQFTAKAVVAEAPGARYWPEQDIDPMLRDGVASIERERKVLAAAGDAPSPLPPEYALALSGGGDAGAFGAGILVGWTERGNRPEFKVVTGVSAGALIAPFAFLGPKYDYVLRLAGGSIQPKDILHWRSWITILSGDGIADDHPLSILIEKYITAEFLLEVAREYAKGRVLLIGTTDLDARRSVIWNMGAIASSPNPRALELFRKVLLASASIPGIFPPVMIDVELNGKRFQEMHVDGGAMRQVFLLPRLYFQDLKDQGRYEPRQRHVFVIRNGRIDPLWSPTVRRSTSVARRALEALIDEQGISDVRHLYNAAQQDGEDFNLAYIDAGFDYPHPKEFAPDFMGHLFDYGYQLGRKGYPWRKSPPKETY